MNWKDADGSWKFEKDIGKQLYGYNEDWWFIK